MACGQQDPPGATQPQRAETNITQGGVRSHAQQSSASFDSENRLELRDLDDVHRLKFTGNMNATTS